MGIHAGRDETALMLHLEPRLVRQGVAQATVPTAFDGFDHVRPGGAVRFGWLVRDLSRNGVIGDPTGATADEGAVMFNEIVALMGEQLTEIRAFADGADRRDHGRQDI